MGMRGGALNRERDVFCGKGPTVGELHPRPKHESPGLPVRAHRVALSEPGREHARWASDVQRLEDLVERVDVTSDYGFPRVQLSRTSVAAEVQRTAALASTNLVVLGCSGAARGQQRACTEHARPDDSKAEHFAAVVEPLFRVQNRSVTCPFSICHVLPSFSETCGRPAARQPGSSVVVRSNPDQPMSFLTQPNASTRPDLARRRLRGACLSGKIRRVSIGGTSGSVPSMA